MYRPEIKVVDCSVRDGGLMNKWQFDDAFVSKVYTALTEAGVDSLSQKVDPFFRRASSLTWAESSISVFSKAISRP